MKRIRVPKKGSILKWLIRNYGIGGFECFTPEQVRYLLEGLKRVLSCCDAKEFHFLGKLFLVFSEYPALGRRLVEEIEDFIVRGE